MKYSSFAIALSACTLAACTEQPTPSLQEKEIILIAGSIKAFNETSQIQLCQSEQSHPIAFINDETTKTLQGLAAPLYTEVYGYFSDTIFNVTQLNLASKEINVCNRPTINTKALGVEPFWSMEILNNQLKYKVFGKEAIEFEIISKDIAKEKRTYKAKQAELTIEAKQCNDGMSDTIYGWQATVSLNGSQQRGCAVIAASDFNA